MVNIRCIALDWSGANTEREQLQTIYVAEAEGNNLVRLRNGLTRAEAIAMLMQEIRRGGPVVIGLDFAFSFPQWYLESRNLDNARELWNLARQRGEAWLDGNTCPFWGRPGPFQRRPEILQPCLQFRQTEVRQGFSRPQSVFKIAGPGHVGTGTIRGFPELARLRKAGARIWPFDAPQPGRSLVVEIYPRWFYLNAVINNWTVAGRDSRQSYLRDRYDHLEKHWLDTMIGSPDAFDAGVSALVMSVNAAQFHGLQQAAGRQSLLEGEIWWPAN